MKSVVSGKVFDCLIKCFFGIFILLFLQNTPVLSAPKFNFSPGNDSVPELNVLETVNSFPGHWLCSNGNYLYGVSLSNPHLIVRKPETGQSIEIRGNYTATDPSFVQVSKIFPTSVPGLLFFLANDSTNNFYLLRSADGGATFSKVFTFGEGNGPLNTNANFVRILRGTLELTRDVPAGGGKGTLFIGEYNISHTRINGSTNDRIRIMKSVDGGITWTKVMEWNTNGLNQIGHIHAMKQDPYTGEIYICTGDSFNKAGLIKWDGTSPFPDNITLPNLAKTPGFRVLTGAQRYRATDVLFDEQSFYIFVDTQAPNNPTGSESGIWKGSKNFDSYVRVNNDVYTYDPMHIGWFGDKIGNAFIFTTSREVEGQFTWKELNTQVYTSSDGNNWYHSGVINMRDLGVGTATNYINSVFSFNNKIYIDCVGGAGHYSTIQCDLSRKWKADEEPVILHPVYFVGKWNSQGNDANNGRNPDAPKKTLKNLLESNRISAGSRVRIASGTFQEDDINPDWSGAFIQGRGSVVLEGRGKDSTIIIHSGNGSNGYGMMLDSTKTLSGKKYPVNFWDLSFSNSVDGGVNHTNYVILNQNTYIKTKGCIIGSLQNDDSPLIRLAGAGAGYISEKSIHMTGKQASEFRTIIESGAENQLVDIRDCLFLYANNAISCNSSEINLSVRFSTFYGIDRCGIIFNGLTSIQPVIADNVFSCAGAPIRDNSEIDEKKIDYNLYSKPGINIGGGSNSILSSADIFVDPGQGDFNLRSNSPATMRGIYFKDIRTDIIGRERWNPPSMGAYESPALAITPNNVVLDSLTGSKANALVLSNISWSESGVADWISLSDASNTGPDNIIVTALSSNESTSPRTCRVIFSGPGVLSDTLTVMQSGRNATNNDSVIKKQLVIYPNPASGSVNINYADEAYDSYTLINSSGTIVGSGIVTLPVQQIDLSGYSDGMYLIRFSGQGTKVKKIGVVHH
jgi:hypothetical protein